MSEVGDYQYSPDFLIRVKSSGERNILSWTNFYHHLAFVKAKYLVMNCNRVESFANKSWMQDIILSFLSIEYNHKC